MMIVNVALVLFFVISFINPKKRFEWRTMGVFIGFIVALFIEMYGAVEEGANKIWWCTPRISLRPSNAKPSCRK